jgi:hypothetical protein
MPARPPPTGSRQWPAARAGIDLVPDLMMPGLD